MTTTLTRRGPRAPAVIAAHRPAHRDDIEGLRAVAVLLVVLAHVGVPGLAGGYVGVDVFFVVSGFLITSLLRREVASTGRLRLARFYARRAVRLLPVATLVTLATLAGSWFLAPAPRFTEHAMDALAAATYTMNLRLAEVGTDYFAGSAPSPFQHFWSLAVEEQFYLVWPVLLVLLMWAGRGRRRVVVPVLLVLVCVSFWYSTRELDRAASWAYFGSLSRAWELGAGALLAFGASSSRRRPALCWVGGSAILAGAVFFDGATPFPGTAALLPVLGTLAVIAARGSRLLEAAPMRWLGRMSYGWYLWHWPLLFLAPTGLVARCLLALGALLLAFLSHHLVENPVRYLKPLTAVPRRGLLLGFGLSGTAAAAAAFGLLFPPVVPTGAAVADAQRIISQAPNRELELRRLVTSSLSAGTLPGNLTPALSMVARQSLPPQDDGCHVGLTGPFKPKGDCVYSDAKADRTVVLFGDSHALQWFPALADSAQRRGWRLEVYTRSACSPAAVALIERRTQRRYDECDTWRDQMIDRIGRLKPDLVVVSSSVNYRDLLADAPGDPDAVWRDGWKKTLGELRDHAGAVAVIGDTPYFTAEPVDCLTSRSTAIGSCAGAAQQVVMEPRWRRIQRSTAVGAGALVVDPLPWMCSSDSCPLVVGNTLVYRDSNHLTEAFVRLVAPLLDSRLPWVGHRDRKK
ncbi:acyltransferase family protein [Actinoplanes sp. NBRC 101535]|uniref:acyltransferase family protein n=1 Tax=Actinoplanes sp. NBRC 101535 TaxID=3032196 RepID=UPI0024A4F2FB|nr:acyltransferase family protein [Actinoplanes sp. NBRC 101535]GLY04881.1 acyltransferase [Actinoplanes sp. NBRC 101535]